MNYRKAQAGIPRFVVYVAAAFISAFAKKGLPCPPISISVISQNAPMTMHSLTRAFSHCRKRSRSIPSTPMSRTGMTSATGARTIKKNRSRPRQETIVNYINDLADYTKTATIQPPQFPLCQRISMRPASRRMNPAKAWIVRTKALIGLMRQKGMLQKGKTPGCILKSFRK